MQVTHPPKRVSYNAMLVSAACLQFALIGNNALASEYEGQPQQEQNFVQQGQYAETQQQHEQQFVQPDYAQAQHDPNQQHVEGDFESNQQFAQEQQFNPETNPIHQEFDPYAAQADGNNGYPSANAHHQQAAQEPDYQQSTTQQQPVVEQDAVASGQVDSRTCFQVNSQTGEKAEVNCQSIAQLNFGGTSVHQLLEQALDQKLTQQQTGDTAYVGTSTNSVASGNSMSSGGNMMGATTGKASYRVKYKVTRTRTTSYAKQAQQIVLKPKVTVRAKILTKPKIVLRSAPVVAPAPIVTVRPVVPVAPVIVKKQPLIWSYLGANLGLNQISFGDKTGTQSARVKSAQLIAGLQYKKIGGLEARVGLGLGASKAPFDCGAGHKCDLSLTAPLTASLFARAQFHTHYITPYVLAGATYQKLAAELVDEYGAQADSKTQFGMAFGGGLEFSAGGKLKLGMEYIRYGEGSSGFGINTRYVF